MYKLVGKVVLFDIYTSKWTIFYGPSSRQTYNWNRGLISHNTMHKQQSQQKIVMNMWFMPYICTCTVDMWVSRIDIVIFYSHFSGTEPSNLLRITFIYIYLEQMSLTNVIISENKAWSAFIACVISWKCQ